jgi:hypothetical protein
VEGALKGVPTFEASKRVAVFLKDLERIVYSFSRALKTVKNNV